MIPTLTEAGKCRELPLQNLDIPLAVPDKSFRGFVPNEFFLVLAVGTGLFGFAVGNLQFKNRPMIACIAFVSKQHVIFLLYI
jgi:hypothetical protein